MSRRFRLHFRGGPLDGLVIPWDGDYLMPGEIVFRWFQLHRPARDEVYRQQLPGLNEDLLRAIVHYRLAEATELQRLYNFELDRTNRQMEYIDRLKQTIERLRGRIHSYQSSKKAGPTRRKKG